ncbi:helix-turn-helix domain-containing protein [Streptomyces sp. NPDC091371]|uniref:helix-turn-helix transcriptional regulator n=1 Tax=Streptomyces sp. NPDC091371 TaxID=3155303 RepID=UPI003428B19D
MLAEHVGPPGAAPEPAEDAVVLGVLTVLLTMAGARGLTVTMGREDPVAVFADDAFTDDALASALPSRDTSRWRFTWSATAPPASAGAPATTSPDVVSRARRLLTDNLARRWTLAVLATELGSSTRSLQRRLHGAGGFQGLLGTVRTEAAADLLLNSGHAVCLVGFACGYADQPHFTRDFKRRTAITPAAYRTAFARPLHEPPAHQNPTEERHR